MDESLYIFYTTVESMDQARDMALALIQKRTAACVNIIGPLSSFYEWEGQIQTTLEHGLLIKTTPSLVDQTRASIQGIHPYDVPCILGWSCRDVHPPFMSWVLSQTQRF